MEGGGAKCIYQLSFLYKLLNSNKFNENYKVNSIHCISFSSIIAYMLLTNNYNYCYELFTKPPQDIFKKSLDFGKFHIFINKIPIINKIYSFFYNILWLLTSITKYGLYVDNTIRKHIENIKNNSNNDLSILNIHVYNLTRNKLEIIKGNHINIKNYLMASIACWLLFPPVKIHKIVGECNCNSNCKCGTNIYCECQEHMYEEYIDAGFIDNIPVCENDKLDEKYCYLLTTDLNLPIKVDKGENLLTYLYNIVNTSSTHHKMTKMRNKLVLNNNCIINNKQLLETTNINQDINKIMLENGEKLYVKYLDNLNNKNCNFIEI
jgi:predicted acylesterase/phospholipase RssA